MLKISFPFSEIGQTLHASCEDVWELITNTKRWHEWGPSITEIDCAERYIKKGAHGKVKIPIGIWVPFVITEYEEMRYWSWRIWGVRATGHKIEPLDECRCNIIFEVPTFASPYLFICWIAIRRIKIILEQDGGAGE